MQWHSRFRSGATVSARLMDTGKMPVNECASWHAVWNFPKLHIEGFIDLLCLRGGERKERECTHCCRNTVLACRCLARIVRPVDNSLPKPEPRDGSKQNLHGCFGSQSTCPGSYLNIHEGITSTANMVKERRGDNQIVAAIVDIHSSLFAVATVANAKIGTAWREIMQIHDLCPSVAFLFLAHRSCSVVKEHSTQPVDVLI